MIESHLFVTEQIPLANSIARSAVAPGEEFGLTMDHRRVLLRFLGGFASQSFVELRQSIRVAVRRVKNRQ